jgi:two-component system, chemotaxis family, protein-glutamate methylesterase/glutaminase
VSSVVFRGPGLCNASECARVCHQRDAAGECRDSAPGPLSPPRAASCYRERVGGSINAEERTRDVVVVGASAGGIQAITELLSRLPADLPAAIGVVIHRWADATSDWSAMLGKNTRLRVVEPAEGDRLAHGVVYVAPADLHMTFGKGEVHLDHGAKRHYTRPAVDPLFTSAALEYKSRVVGVVLTGGGHDGVQGLLDIKAAGGIALAQKPSEAEVSSMPSHAIVGAHVDAALSLDEIGDALVRLASGLAVEVDCPVDRPAKA